MTCASAAVSSSTSTMVAPTFNAPGKRARRGVTSARAMASANCATITNTRIGDPVQQVGGKIGQAEHRSQHQNCCLHQRQILSLQCEDQQSPKPGVSEDGFNRNDAA